MNNKKSKVWNLDSTIKIISTIITISAFFLGIYQFGYNQKALKNLEYEKIFTIDSLQSEQRLLEKKMEVYSKIGESVGSILSIDKMDTNFSISVMHFEKIYYGEAIIVEDSSVNKIMKLFKFSTNDYQEGFIGKTQLNLIGMALCDSLKKDIQNKKTVYHYK
jgi:hypothetical protein